MKANFFWLMFLLLTFLVTLPMSWLGMAKTDFFYPTLYDVIEIDSHINRYAPRNRFNKLEFERTDKHERLALFHGVVQAIHENGRGLEALSYIKQSSSQEITLFIDAEITHLKDVAVLLNKMKSLTVVFFVIWSLVIVWLVFKRIKLPSTKNLVLLSLLLVLIGVSILSLGPEKVFNQLHVWAFPDDHQWFFYYEESLMSTMMKAPDLFGYISAIWVSFSVLLTVLLLSLLHLFQNNRR